MTAAATLPEVTVGQILVMREELAAENRNANAPVRVRLRASRLVQVLDELIERRRKDADAVEASAPQPERTHA